MSLLVRYRYDQRRPSGRYRLGDFQQEQQARTRWPKPLSRTTPRSESPKVVASPHARDMPMLYVRTEGARAVFYAQTIVGVASCPRKLLHLTSRGMSMTLGLTALRRIMLTPSIVCDTNA